MKAEKTKFEDVVGGLTTFNNKFICPDIEKQKTRYVEEFKSLISQPENFKHRLNEFQTERMIENTFSGEKSNRIILIMTFVMLVFTIVMVLK